jgi:ABC-type multidrug transport system fused ATPase/permease subunit
MLLNRVMLSIRQTSSVNATTKSPVISLLNESIVGASTIRAFKKQDDFIKRNNALLNNNIKATIMNSGVNQWFCVRIDILSVFTMFCFSLVCVLTRDFVDPIVLSLLLNYGLGIPLNLSFLLRMYSSTENMMVNVSRCLTQREVLQEKSDSSQPLQDRPSWPEKGEVEFRGVSLRYRPNTEQVLHQLSFKVPCGEKVGVVGRTGAGKSTICLSMSRMIELEEGQIIIDGIDIATIPLKQLRSRITVIPQDPTIFKDSLRFNLDPENKV